jgi:phosphoadenosine phosphosulfate reductase
MLIASPRHTARDLEVWATHARTDAILGRMLARGKKPARALQAIRDFVATTRAYVSVSWGKDSTVVAHLAWLLRHEIDLPLVWVKGSWWFNPDCERVRDAFLQQHPGLRYEEIVVEYDYTRELTAASSLYFRHGLAEAVRRHGPGHITGVRAQESRVRRISMCKFGENSASGSMPLGWWTTKDVFAYLEAHDLPVHPIYAMTMGGLFDREHLRVDMLAEERGAERGRVEHEWTYYRDEIRAIRARDEAERTRLGVGRVEPPRETVLQSDLRGSDGA